MNLERYKIMVDLALKAVKNEKEVLSPKIQSNSKIKSLNYKFQTRIPFINCHFYKDSFTNTKSVPTIEVAATGLAMDFSM